ncbi:hypothetical protein F2Q68_00043906 [Brassica cretica]|uniref:Serine-threonine kinase receptor-associated protein n=1 Tax=Brassica cretica TaxID=69181 RepID=A0A8S9LJT2_BRACR|nr:hypothetical protein F2Q68_00043906 [Brassica cretica]
MSPGSGGSFSTSFTGFCLREKMVPSHRLRRLFTGVLPVPFDRRFMSFDLPPTLDLILCRLPFPEIRRWLSFLKWCSGCVLAFREDCSVGLSLNCLRRRRSSGVALSGGEKLISGCPVLEDLTVYMDFDDDVPLLRNFCQRTFLSSLESNEFIRGSNTDSVSTFMKLWDALTGDVLHSFEHKHIVRACAFSEDTKLLITGGFEKILRVFDLNRLDAPPTEVDKSPGSIRTLTWLHSDQTILTSCTDIGGVRLWDVRSGKIVQTLETKSPVTSAEVSQDGRYITTADGSSVKFWDANHFGLVKSYDMPCNIESASLEPKSGEKFVAGGEDMWVRMFDFYTGEEIGCNKGHHGPVHCVRFSPTGESYASGSEDGTIRIWQTTPNHSVDEVAKKIEGFHINKEGKTADKLSDA